MIIASILGVICNLVSCSMADRYRAHHLVHTVSLLIAFAAFVSMFVPIFSDMIYDSQANHLAPMDPRIAVADLSASFDDAKSLPSTNMRTEATTSTSTANQTAETTETRAPAFERLNENSFSVDLPTPEQRLPDNTWFYWISAAIIIGEIAAALCMNLSDSMSANIALKCGRPFGVIKFWGAIGLVTSALVLSYINTIQWVPFLAPAFGLYTILALINILIVVFWPDKRPFDLAAQSTVDQTSECCIKDLESTGGSMVKKQKLQAEESSTNKLKFKLGNKFSPLNKFKPTSIQDELSMSNIISDRTSVRLTSKLHPIAVVRFARASSFDTREEDIYRNIRRCSLAPLGEQHVVKQFELNKASGKHFKFVTHIETKGESKVNGLIDYNLQEQDTSSYLSFDSGESQKSSTSDQDEKGISFKVHLKIIQMIVLRDKLVLRFLFLFMVNGFTLNMNWLYLFPYLRSLDEVKFRSLSAYILIGCNLSETLFYYISPNFTRKFRAGINLSIILFIYTFRYSLYLLFALENTPVPLELIIVVELLQALNFSWFVCVLNETSLTFALGAKNHVSDLIRSGLIDDSKDMIEKVNNGVKVTMLCIASCCSEGFGVALGSLCGGWLVDQYGYATLWIVSASIAFSIAVLNLIIELYPSNAMTNTETTRGNCSSPNLPVKVV